MAIEFFYSKKYSENGAPVRTPVNSDYFALSRVVLPNPPYIFGFRTYIATLEQLKNYTITDIRTNLGNFHVDSTLVGNGTQANPLSVNDSYLDSVYYKNQNWPMTQVGDPAESTLPISGSYFSVTYPYNDSVNPLAIFVEGNGDLRILRKVTNGERIAVCYGVWKNYRNTAAGDGLVLSDTVYRPPGLAADEYIYHVHNASDTAMLVVIWDDNGFKEYAFVTLNETLIDTYHELIRLGTKPITNFISNDVAFWFSKISYTDYNAVIVNGKKYIGLTLPSGIPVGEDNYFSRMRIAEVTDDGQVNLIQNWTVTNSEGKVFATPNPVIHDANVTYSDDPGAAYSLVGDPSSISVANSYGGIRTQWAGSKSNGLVVMASNYYHELYTPSLTRDVKPFFYYDINFETRTIVPSNGAWNRRWIIGVLPNGHPNYIRRSMTYFEGHYFASTWKIHLLNTGERILQGTPGKLNIYQTLYAFRGTATSLDTATDDNHFVNQTVTATILNVTPPTPVRSGLHGQILHDKLRILDWAGEGYGNLYNEWSTKTLSLLSGPRDARTFKLLQGNSWLPRINYPGYVLNNNRTVIPNPQPSMLTQIRKNGTVYHHNASWCRVEPNRDYSYTFDSSSNPYYTYRFDQNARNQVEAFAQSVPMMAGYTEIDSLHWIVIPSYPGIGENWALVRVLVSFRRPSNNLFGFEASSPQQLYCIVPIGINIDSVNTATIAWMDFSGANTNYRPTTGYFRMGMSGTHPSATCMAVDVQSDRLVILSQGGTYSDDLRGSGTTAQMWPTALAFDFNRNLTIINETVSDYNACITCDVVSGVGIVNLVGLGALYVYQRYDIDSNTFATPANAVVVGTARPAEGFNYTVTAPIDVFIDGKSFTIPVQTVDLTTISSAYKNTIFYVYAQMFNGVAKLLTSKEKLEEHMYLIYLGYITTTTTDIDEINCRPVTRWEIARVSPAPIGTSIGSSIGTPASTTGTVWESAAPLGGTGTEYLWGGDDIVDTDDRS